MSEPSIQPFALKDAPALMKRYFRLRRCRSRRSASARLCKAKL